MGSSQGPIFRQEFRVEVDHAMVKLNLDEQVRMGSQAISNAINALNSEPLLQNSIQRRPFPLA
jgi:hypothetical protein